MNAAAWNTGKGSSTVKNAVLPILHSIDRKKPAGKHSLQKYKRNFLKLTEARGILFWAVLRVRTVLEVFYGIWI